MLEIAQWLSAQKQAGRLPANRDILFAAWSGEEDGLIGSNYFVKNYPLPNDSIDESSEPASQPTSSETEKGVDVPDDSTTTNGKHDSPADGLGAKTNGDSEPTAGPRVLYPYVAACLNMDMVGRLRKNLILQGVGSSEIWTGEIERRNLVLGLPILVQEDSYIPTDASVFYLHGVPILSAFTGSHPDYHTPQDTPDKLNYQGAANIAKFMGLVARSLALRDAAPDYLVQARPDAGKQRAQLRAYLGTVPDYAESDVKGVKLSAVAKKGPADSAGIRAGDVIVQLAGRKIENIYDYTYAIEALKIGRPVAVVVQRGDKQVELQITPGSRD